MFVDESVRGSVCVTAREAVSQPKQEEEDCFLGEDMEEEYEEAEDMEYKGEDEHDD